MIDGIVKLAAFLDALDKWGCDDNTERAKQIVDFQQGGCDLPEYVDEDQFRRGQEADYQEHLSRLTRERDWR